jgi:hypothetical protein
MHRLSQIPANANRPAAFSAQLLQPGIVDGQAPFAQRSQLLGIHFHHGHIGAEFGEAGSRNQTDLGVAQQLPLHPACLGLMV